MMQYKLHVHDRKYSSWSFFDENNHEIDPPKLCSDFHPSIYKMYHNDVFAIEDDGIPKVIHSEVNETKIFAGVLLLSSGQTYGRSSNGRLYYKCICHEPHYPELLVPYDQKLGFSKAISNKYVTFSFKDWSTKHPTGILRETLGNVNDLDTYYEYSLHAKNIHYSLTSLTKHLKTLLKETPMDKQLQNIMSNPKYQICDKREQCYVYSIDPEGSTDLDDAFSCQQLEENPDHYRVCVYISNVFLWLEQMELWPFLSNRVSTVYFPNKKRTMLPTLFSEDWFSLLEKKDRLAFTMDLLVHKDGYIIPDTTQFYSSIINVRKNFVYDEPKLLNNKHYTKLEQLTKSIDPSIIDSHDVVSFWMIQMNVTCANKLSQCKTGVFRQSSFKNKELTKEFEEKDYDHQTKQMLSHWNNVSCQYTMFKGESEENHLKHEVMNRDYYVHITSPIRRLVDILNQICFYKDVLQTEVSAMCSEFLQKECDEMDFINISMKSIRKIQNDCNLLFRFYNDNELQNKVFEGILIQKKPSPIGFSYLIYNKEHNAIHSFECIDDYALFDKKQFNMYLFEDEHICKRKIRIQLL